MNKLLEAYSGDKAVGYDARRATSTRWRNEISAMEAMLGDVSATKILDCPFGTGRWIPQYAALGADVVGVDLSAGMLAEAQAKVDALPDDLRDRFTLHEGSIFDLDPASLPNGIDLVMCIRFLNWISLDDVRKVIPILTGFQTDDMIVGASVVPKTAGPVRRWWYRTSLNMINKRHPERPAQHVHDESDFLQILDQAGWTVVDQREIMRRNARLNYFYRLRRKSA